MSTGTMNSLGKPLIFITGSPRSGTSLLAKLVDSHPDVAILMENILGNRRRHWMRENFWNFPMELREETARVYSRLQEPVVGNKVITPDVWDAGDIIRFCHLFKSFKILFIVRNPLTVSLSRLRREPADFFQVFNAEARKYILLDFRSRFHTYISSWRQSIENYWRLKDGFKDNLFLVYYEDLCREFEPRVKEIFSFLGIPFSAAVLRWHELPHHNAEGELVRDLKYPDREIFINDDRADFPKELIELVKTVKWQYDLWDNRRL